MAAPRASVLLLTACDEFELDDAKLLGLLLDYVDEFCIAEHVEEYVLNHANPEPKPITDADLAAMRTIMQVMES